QHPDRFLQNFRKGSADGHDFAHRLHFGADPMLYSVELLQVPPRDLAHDIVERRLKECAGGFGDRIGENILDTPSDLGHTGFMESAKPKTLMEAIRHYADPDNSLNEVADSRWPKGITCQHCGAERPMFLKTRRIWKCSKCRKQFSIKTKS